MFCGTGSFSHADEDAQSKSRKRDKNPYAAQGLDKFSSVLAELEARRKKILASAGDVSMVRFMQSSSEEWVPIVVRLTADRKQEKAKPLPESRKGSEATKQDLPAVAKTEMAADKIREKKRFSWGLRPKWRPSYYWPMVMVLILSSLVMFGRVFAICCTSIWWYLLPTMERRSGDHNRRRKAMKKDYGRRLSDKRLGVHA